MNKSISAVDNAADDHEDEMKPYGEKDLSR